jgi:thimet oligopeptidase
MSRVIHASLLVLVLGACSGSSSTTNVTPGPGPGTGDPVTDTTAKPPPASPVEAFAADCRAGLEKAREIRPTITAVEGKRTIENTLDPYNDMMIAIYQSAGTAGLMYSVHPEEAIREEARACEQEVEKFLSDLRLDKELYQTFVDLDLTGFDADTRRLVEHTLRDYRRFGVDRDEQTRQRLAAIDEELTVLGQAFSKNIVDDVRYIEVDGPEALAGLPKDFIDSHKPGENGKIRITTDYPDYIPFISYADDNDLRKELYIKFKARGGEENETVLKKILTLRHEKANLLGYANWADYATEDKMMKSGKAAQEFIDKITGVARKRAERDYKELLARKKKIDKKARRVEDYEKSYLENKVKAESYSFDPQSVRPYFEYEAVEKGLLDITSTIYDVEYLRVTDDPLIWHQDVKSFDVMRDGTKLGRIYLDMHPREGKYKHAAQFPYRSGVAGKQLPIGVLVCNFPNPRTSEGGPALMEHDDVATMFHEFGHLMHHTLGGNKRWISQSGVATEWDFVEAPSQMFEEWAWNHDTLSGFARHHETGELIPAELVERMRKADKFGLGLSTLQQMFYASISLTFHTMDPAKLDMTEQIKKLQAKYTPFAFVEGTLFQSNFGHLSGYSALYYTYMWSLVIAKDLLTPFKEHGLMNTEWTFRYRDRILAPGGTKDAAVLVKDFLGREYTFDAFKEYLTN